MGGLHKAHRREHAGLPRASRALTLRRGSSLTDSGDWRGTRLGRRNPLGPEPLYAMGLPGPVRLVRLVRIARRREGPGSIPGSDRLRPHSRP